MNATAEQKVILVLGMHRSGTSVIARTLGLCGGDLPKTTQPPIDPNGKQQWEPDVIVRSHDRELLEPKGRRWHDVVGLPRSWFQSDEAAAFKRRLATAYREEFDSARMSVLKDPRICRLLPLWLPIIRELPADPYAVILVRSPLEVAASLKERNRMSLRKALSIWLRHFLEAEHDTRDIPRCFVSYEDLLDDWRVVIGHINRDLALDLRPPTSAVADDISRYVSRDVRNHQISNETLASRTDVPAEIKLVYQWADRACHAGPDNSEILDRAMAECVTEDAAGDRLRSIYRFWRRRRQIFHSHKS